MQKNLTIFVNNNNGGQIFNLLPQAKNLNEIYDEWFVAPHKNLNILKLANSIDCQYFNPSDEKRSQKK